MVRNPYPHIVIELNDYSLFLFQKEQWPIVAQMKFLLLVEWDVGIA